jgi:catechol 2,3-dioxygenase-like lactoylglutathione lyase family enzyme
LNDAPSILWLLLNSVNAYLPAVAQGAGEQVEMATVVQTMLAQPWRQNRYWRAIMTEARKPRLIGINHVAIEVGNIDEALAWYGRIFDFALRGKGERNAFIDMGDQFINMTLVPNDAVEGVEKRHLGFVVDDRSRIIELAKAAGARFVEGPFLDFLDPWGNRLEIIEYSNIQFTKAPNVMRGMGLALAKNDKAKQELADKGMAD